MVPAAEKSRSSGCAAMASTRLISASSSTPAILGRGGAPPPGGLLVRDQSRGGPGQGLLLEERGAGPDVPAVEKEDDAGQAGRHRDDEGASDLPVQAGDGPPGVVVPCRHVVRQPHG